MVSVNAATLTALAARAADIAETIGDTVTRVEMSEMADGSHRHYALVYTYDRTNDLEQEFRVSTPAPDGAPAWASVFRGWEVSVRTGDSWLVLETA